MLFLHLARWSIVFLCDTTFLLSATVGEEVERDWNLPAPIAYTSIRALQFSFGDIRFKITPAKNYRSWAVNFDLCDINGLTKYSILLLYPLLFPSCLSCNKHNCHGICSLVTCFSLLLCDLLYVGVMWTVKTIIHSYQVTWV